MEREPKRPFALMYVFAKIIEPGAPSLIRRTLPERLDEGRYASRGERCAETHLLELSYFTEEAKLRANCTYVAPVDRDTSSERVSRRQFLGWITEPWVWSQVFRSVRNWLLGRVFRAELASLMGPFFSNFQRMLMGGTARGGIAPATLDKTHRFPAE